MIRRLLHLSRWLILTKSTIKQAAEDDGIDTSREWKYRYMGNTATGHCVEVIGYPKTKPARVISISPVKTRFLKDV